MARIAALFCLLLIIISNACTPPPTFSTAPKRFKQIIYVDEHFASWQENAIINSLKHLECSTNGLFTFEIKLHSSLKEAYLMDKDNSVFIKRTDGNDEIIKREDKKVSENYKINRYILGLYIGYEPIPVILLVNERLPKYDDVYRTALHEILHARFIPEHSSNANSIFYPRLDEGASNLTIDDLKEICRVYICDIRTLNLCKDNK